MSDTWFEANAQMHRYIRMYNIMCVRVCVYVYVHDTHVCVSALVRVCAYTHVCQHA